MSKSFGDGSSLDLTGTGSAYVRVSTDQQDTLRQYKSIHSFEAHHKVRINRRHWYEDEGWARDAADKRPAFQEMIKAAEDGLIQWIVVDRLDRFGTKSAKQLMHYLYRLNEAGCQLFDATGRDWTATDDSTEISSLIEGKRAAQEPRVLSARVLGGKATKAEDGHWQGGPVRLGFDVACFAYTTGPHMELWRVVFEGKEKRMKAYPDGRPPERFDGKGNFPPHQKKLEYLRIVPSQDQARIDAAISVFKRYATEAISPTTLAHYLNKLKFTNSYGGIFQGHHIDQMLRDPIYRGYYAWNRSHHGKFHKYTKGQPVPELNLDERVSKNDAAEWIWSRQLFDPLVGEQTWNAVRAKLDPKLKRAKAPRSPALFLSGLVYCANCGERMVAGPVRKPKGQHNYFCSTYHKAARAARRSTDESRSASLRECKCLRNCVYQSELDKLVDRFFEETEIRLNVLADGIGPNTSRLDAEEIGTWRGFVEGIAQLTEYLAKHHPDEYAAILKEDEAQHAEDEAAMRTSAGSPGGN